LDNMNRTLRRPMFRMGGAAEGITSGLDKPRKQFFDGSQPNPRRTFLEAQQAAIKPDILKMMYSKQFPDKTEEQVQTEVDNFLSGKDNIIADTNTTNTTNNTNMMQTTGDAATGGLTRDQIIAQAMADAQKFSGSQEPMSRNEMLARFLIPFGLNLATATPTGGLLSTAAGAAKQPVEMLVKGIDQRREAKTEREADLFAAFLSSGLQERREDKKLAAQKLKDSRELLTLYDKTKEENVIVRAGDVYNNLENYGPAETDKEGRTFEKLEVANQIKELMGTIFELKNQENLSGEEQLQLEQAETVLDYLKGNKNTKIFASELLRDPNFLADVRTVAKNVFETTDKYKEFQKDGITDQEELYIQRELDKAVKFYLETGTFPPEYMGAQAMATGGRAGYQMGGGADMGQMPTNEPIQKIDYETLRARLPKEITDDIVRLIASSPEALEDFATIQTQQDVVLFNQKYDVELVLPAEA
jgi:hypothetical protein